MSQTETQDVMSRAFFATVPLGMEGLLASELRDLGIDDVLEKKAGVAFRGDLADAYKACLWSRLANRVLMPLHQFPSATVDQLYAGVRVVDWPSHLEVGAALAVDFSSSRSAIQHTLFGAQKVKDAVVDEFRAQGLERPAVDRLNPDLRINVYLDRDLATVSLDLSGDSLHRRGYRTEGGKAPLKENLAAALLLRGGWPGVFREGGGLVDPMCGSGTLPIEAALMAADRAPGLNRSWYGFMGWRGHQADLWFNLLDEARARFQKGFEAMPPIAGFDQDGKAIQIAKANLERAGLQGAVLFERCSIERAAPQSKTGLVIANPPYGERLGEEGSLEPLYRALGETLRTRFKGFKATLFTGNPELSFKLGVRALKSYSLHNGRIPCKLFNFEIEDARFFTPHEGGPLSEEEREQRSLMRKVRGVDLEAGGAQMLANRLRKNLKHLGRWARQEAVSCYRVYDADLPEYAIAVDLYEGEGRWVHVQEYEAPSTIDPKKAEARLIEALAAIPVVLELPQEALYLKVRRRQKGLAQYEKQSEKGQFQLVREGGLKFRVNFEDYLDTGLFLDHRMIRDRIRAKAKGTRFLNLFAYTGSATVYAAAGGASSTTTVDLSRTYLEWAEKNLAVNGFLGERHRLIQADCLEWLTAAVAEGQQFDLIFMDPPTFSTSKRMRSTLDIQRDHVHLIRDAMALLSPRGTLIFSTNLRKFKLDQGALEGLWIKEITRDTLPRDFERNPRIHSAWEICIKTA